MTFSCPKDPRVSSFLSHFYSCLWKMSEIAFEVPSSDAAALVLGLAAPSGCLFNHSHPVIWKLWVTLRMIPRSSLLDWLAGVT